LIEQAREKKEDSRFLSWQDLFFLSTGPVIFFVAEQNFAAW